MGNHAIIRIVIWSIVLVILVGILALGLGTFRLPFDRNRTDRDSSGYMESDPSGSGSNICAFAAADIQDLEIEWVSGKIVLQTDDTADTIRIREDFRGNDQYRMVYKQTGNTLSIRFSMDSISFTGFGFNLTGDLSKDLTVLVPSGWICEELEIDTASADLLVQDMTIRRMDFDGASGTCDFENSTVDQLDMDTASGNIRFHGNLDTLDFDAASASFRGELLNIPRNIKMDSMSGDLELTLPEDAGFSVTIDGMSCTFSSDFSYEMRSGRYIHGNGSCQIDVDGMSCDVMIHKGT